MKKFPNERAQIRGLLGHWNKNYPPGTQPIRGEGIRARIEALDVESASAEDAAAAIGNGSWVCMGECDECGAKSWDLMIVGEPQDHDSATAEICEDCLKAALRMLKAT